MTKALKPGSTSLYPLPVVLVSCGIEKPNIITLAWAGTFCSDPPSVGIGVRPERFSHHLLAEAGEFVVNIPSADLVDVVDYCGHASGRDVDKWTACGLTQDPAEKIRTPLVGECPVALECRTTNQVTLGSHDLFIGQVVAVRPNEEVLRDGGPIEWGRADLVAYAGGYYYRIGQQLGRHGDWRGGIR